jgi:hypothetical protein
MKTSEQTNEIFAAIAVAQGKMQPAAKDSINPHFKSRYADLASVVEVGRENLAGVGLAVIQEPLTDIAQGYVGVRTRITHKSGQWVELEPLWAKPARGLGAQEIGAAVTYLRRYTHAPAVGITTDDDDDGETAEGRGKRKNAPTANEGQSKPSVDQGRIAKTLAAFKSIGWSEQNVVQAVGCKLVDFTDEQFDFAFDLYQTEKQRRAQESFDAKQKFEG